MSTLEIAQTQNWEEQASHRPSHYPAGPGLVLLLVVLPLLLLPMMVRQRAVRHLETLIPAPVAIAKVDLNLFTGKAQIRDLVIGGNGAGAILHVPALDVHFSRRALLRREVIIHRATARQPALRLERTGHRHWNVSEIFHALVEGDAGTGQFTLNRLDIQGGQVTVLDHMTNPIATSHLRDLAVTVQPVPITPGEKPGQVTAEFHLDEAPARMDGTLHLNPFASQLKVTATRVPLTFFQGYVQHFLPGAEAVAGDLDGHLNVAAGLNQEADLVIEISGTAEGRDVALGFGNDKKPFFLATRLRAESLRATNMPVPHAEVPQLQIAGATFRLERESDGNFNLRQLWATAPIETWTGPSSSGASNVLAPLAIRHVMARDSRIVFADHTLTPSFAGALSGTTVEISKPSRETDRASLKIQGTLEGSAPVDLQGWFTVAQPFTVHLEGSVQDYELSKVNPYAVKYVRHQVQRGRVSTGVKYRYENGRLAAGNEIRIRKIKVGDPIEDEFEGQVGIPLKLALALLEGLDGEIHLQVPVEGQLDNPEFRFNKVVWSAVQNAIVKGLTAPLRLIGKLVTVAGKITAVRIDPIAFQAGSPKPDAAGVERLDRLVTFLRTRPNVELQLRGRASHQEMKALPQQRNPGSGSPEQQLRKLAEERARFIERTLVRRGIAAKRLFVLTGDADAVKKQGAGQVEFRLL